MADTNPSPEAKLDSAIQLFDAMGKKGNDDAADIARSLEAIKKHEQEQGWKDYNPDELIQPAAKRILAFAAIAEAKVEHGTAEQQAQGKQELAAVETFVKGSLAKEQDNLQAREEEHAVIRTAESNLRSQIQKETDPARQDIEKKALAAMEAFPKEGNVKPAGALWETTKDLLAANASAMLDGTVPKGGVEAVVKKFEEAAVPKVGLGDFIKAADENLPAPRVDPQEENERREKLGKIENALRPVEQALRNTLDPEGPRSYNPLPAQEQQKPAVLPGADAIAQFKNLDPDIGGRLQALEAMEKVTHSVDPAMKQNVENGIAAYLKNNSQGAAAVEKALQGSDVDPALKQIKDDLIKTGLIHGDGQSQNAQPAAQTSLPKVAMANTKSTTLGA